MQILISSFVLDIHLNSLLFAAKLYFCQTIFKIYYRVNHKKNSEVSAYHLKNKMQNLILLGFSSGGYGKWKIIRIMNLIKENILSNLTENHYNFLLKNQTKSFIFVHNL